MGALDRAGRAFNSIRDGITGALRAVLENPSPEQQQGRLPGTLPRPDQLTPVKNQPKIPNIQVINDWVVPSTLGWTLDAVQNAVLQLEQGNMLAPHSLMLAMTRDATIGHGLKTRIMSLTALEWEIEWPRCVPQAARDSLLRQLPEAITPQDQATASGYTVMLGIAPLAQRWFLHAEKDGTELWQWRTEALEAGHLVFRPDTRTYFFQARSGLKEVVDDGNAFALSKSLCDRRHHLDSAVRTLATLWFIIQEAVRYHRAYNAEYGRPIKGLKVPDSHRLTEDVAQLVQQASGIYGGSVIVLPQFGDNSDTASFDLTLIEAKSRGFGTFLELAKVCRDLITLYLIGVLETTGGKSASNAKAQTQLKVADRYVAADARIREDYYNRILARWAEFNAFDEAPRLKIRTEPPTDEKLAAETAKAKADALKATVEALKGMKDLGVRIGEAHTEALLRSAGYEVKRAQAAELDPALGGSSGEVLERLPDSVLVCWVPPAVLAMRIAVPGGEPWDQLHLTLALCPGAAVADVIAAVVAASSRVEEVWGTLGGVAAWPVGAVEGSGPDGEGLQGQLAFCALVDAPGLGELREGLLDALSAAGVQVRRDHGFIPHVTRAYLPVGSRVEALEEREPVVLDSVQVWACGGKVRVPVRLGRG